MKLVPQTLDDVIRIIQQLQRDLEDERSARRGRSTEISEGDLTIRNGGNVKILDGGRLLVAQQGRIAAFGPTTLSHMADGWLWVETIADPADPFSGGTHPRALLQTDRLIMTGTNPAIVSTIRQQADGSLTLNSSNNQVAVGHNTTSASANAVMDAFGILMRSTSSRRYKQDISDVDIDPAAVLALRPRMWRDRRECENDPDTGQHYVGFIAEEMDEAGLHQFVIYDEDGQPDAIAYDRLAVALVALAQSERKQRETAETKTAELEKTVEGLGTQVGKLTAAVRGLLPKGTL